MKKSTLIICLLACSGFIQAQAPAWVQFATPSDDQNYDDVTVATGVDSLGNIYTAASSEDTVGSNDQVTLVKYNPAGVQQWKKTYSPNSTSNSVYARNILVDKAGNSYVCGYGYHNGTSSKDYMVLKYDNAGNQVWAQFWDGGQNSRDYITCATFDAAGNIVVGGYCNFQGTTWDDLGVVKWDPSGTMLWNYIYNNSPQNGEDRAIAIASDIRNNIYITGESVGSVARDMITIKLNSAGVNQWTKRVRGATNNDDRGFGVAADTAGNCYVTGALDDWATIKYDKNGNVLWTNHYTDDDLNRYNTKKVLVDRHNNVVVAGDAFNTTGEFSNVVINHLDFATGSSQSTEEFDFGGSDAFGDMVMDTSGTVYMVGQFDGPVGRDLSSAIVTPAGTTLWTDSYTNSTYLAGGELGYQIVVDKNRNMIIAGVAETRSGGNDNADVFTLKYAALVVGVREIKLNEASLSMYPNPSEGAIMLNVSDPALIGSVVSISNLTGQTLINEKIKSLNQTFNLEQLDKGIYLVTIHNQAASTTKKLIIK